MEVPFFLARDGATLFAILHLPDGSAPRSGFVMSHPFAEEKLWSHRVFVSFARALASRGHAVLRFDFMGSGDSSGVTRDTSLESHLADLAAAYQAIHARVPTLERTGLVGLRLGATLAALFAARARSAGTHPQLSGAPLLLWEPVLDGESYFQEILRSNLSTQLAVYGRVLEDREALQEKLRGGGTVNVDGYEIGKALFDSCARTDLLTAAMIGPDNPVQVVQIAQSEKSPERKDLVSFAGACGRGVFERVVEQPFWREIKPFYGSAPNLQPGALRWLENCGA